MVEYIIRYAKKSDLRKIAELTMEAWPNWWARNEKNGENHIRNQIKDKRVIVATIGNKIVAYALFGVIWSELHFEDCFVKKEYRRKGIGSALLRERVEIAKKMGLRKVISDCDADNTAAQKYHVKNGFRKCGYIEKLWGNKDSYVFSKEL